MRIACLHTADSNAAVFAQAASGKPVVLTHMVRAELLAEAEARGGLTADVAARTAQLLRSIARGGDGGAVAGVDGVLLTCSTLGPAVDLLAADAAVAVPILRVDAALARAAVRQAGGGPIVVLYAVETTRGPTQALFEGVAAADPRE